MKKLFGLFAALLLALGLTSCGGGTVLADANHDYYATGNFAGWGDATSKVEYKMTAIATNDSRVSSIKSGLNNATGLYILEITLPADAAGWDVGYTINGVEKKYDGNLTVKVIQTDTGSNVPNYWAQNPESGKVTSLTPETLYIPPFVEENVNGAGTWNDNPVAIGGAGNYYIVFATFSGSKAMALIKR